MVASPKSSAKEPISVDIILVCKKYSYIATQSLPETTYARELRRAEIELSRTDHFNIRAGLLLVNASRDQMHPIEVQFELVRLKESVLKD